MSTIDLDAYFARIGFTGARAPTLDTLGQIHLKHALAIPFENIDPLIGRTPQLDLLSLHQKMVLGGRGGYCFEHNALFRHALEALGFEVSGLAARVMWNVPEGVLTGRGHMLLRIDLRGTSYVADVGFGGQTLTGPLVLEPNVEQTTPHEPYRLIPVSREASRRSGGDFIMETKVGHEWRSLYRFDLLPQFPPDYEVTNFYLANHPTSPFVTGLMGARPAEGKRYALRNNVFTTHSLSAAAKEQRTLTSVAEWRAVLEGPFGITLPDTPALDAALERVLASSS
ncbi:MAG TPA: arylamine N-acetyltransferase [Polyangiaceae bacterium]|nr:arylamine N-acetyltransferase [Polyangiaceae bacterium]